MKPDAKFLAGVAVGLALAAASAVAQSGSIPLSKFEPGSSARDSGATMIQTNSRGVIMAGQKPDGEPTTIKVDADGHVICAAARGGRWPW